MNAIRPVILKGEMGRLFGEKWDLEVATPRQAVSLINANTDGALFNYIRHCHDKGLGFHVICAGEQIDSNQVTDAVDEGEAISIMPIPIGAKEGGLLNVILGIALVGVSFLIPGGGFLAGLVLNVGVAMTVGGISQLITGTPNFESIDETPASKPSYHFGGPITRTQPGGIYDIVFGEVIKGPTIVSAGITNDLITPTTQGGGAGGSIVNPVFDPDLGDGYGGYDNEDLGIYL